MRRIGVLASNLAADDPEWVSRSNAFVQGLQKRGWSDGRNVRIEYRFGLGDPDRLRKYAAELVALAPDVIVAGGTQAALTLRGATRTLPIVFGNPRSSGPRAGRESGAAEWKCHRLYEHRIRRE